MTRRYFIIWATYPLTKFQIRTILDFQCLASLQHNSRMMTEMTRLTRQENRMMVQITKKASRDQDILKVITLIALVYLPASFVSVSVVHSTCECKSFAQTFLISQ
jgi:hypothetical protein